MEPTLEELLRAYKTDFPQEVRDLAETFCNATTRLANAPANAPRALTDEMRHRAAAHGIRDEDLAAAVAQYTRIEALAESSHLQKSRG